MKKLVFTCLTLFIFGQVVLAQQVRQKIGTNPYTITPSAALEIEATDKGLLVPRMSSVLRDAIPAPADALLIWNTSNNQFEVYKNSCYCWVGVVDNGNTPASNILNTAPTVSNIVSNGQFRVGGTVTINYLYSDSQNDPEGATTINWEIADTNTGAGLTTLATGTSVTFTLGDANRFVRIAITPRASSGILNGLPVYGNWIQIGSSALPYVSAVSTSGTPEQGSVLTGSYTFNGGIVSTENATGSTYTWQTANNAYGLNIATVSGATNTTLSLTAAQVGKYIRFGVTAKDASSNVATAASYSNWVGPVQLSSESAPVATNVTYSPTPGENLLLTGSYTFADSNSDPEGASIYKWYTADDAAGTNTTVIPGATARTFRVTAAQVGKYIGFGVTPVAQSGTLTGTPVVYFNAAAATVSGASFSFNGTLTQSNNYNAGRVMNSMNTLTVGIAVTTAGAINFSTNTVDGYTFTGGGIYPVGTTQVTLTASGIKATYGAAGNTFTITAAGATTQTLPVTIANVKTGSDLTSHYNGIINTISVDNTLASYTSGETFSANVNCYSSIISTSTCVTGSTVTGASGTIYNTVNINGQCWLKENLKELPNGNAINATQWLAASPPDSGFYGFFNTVNTSGSSGWSTTEPAAGEGILYQWSAAMAGATQERAQGVCPTGFHVPSDCEWMYLEHGVGMSLSDQQNLAVNRSNNLTSQGTPAYKLRGFGTNYTNASGFTGLLIGFRNTNGAFSSKGNYGLFWTSTISSNPNNIFVHAFNGSSVMGIERSAYTKTYGFSVRCLKD